MGLVFSITFCALFFKESNFSYYIFLTDQINSLTDSTSEDIGQYIYNNYLLSGLWRHKF